LKVSDDLVKALKALAGGGEPMGPRRAPTWNRIVSIATKVLVTQGFQGASMEEIAAAAEVSRATLYNYAPSKEQLLLSALAQETLSHLDRLAPGLDETRPAKDRLFEMVKSGLMLSEYLPLMTRLLLHEPQRLEELARQPAMLSVMSQFPGADKGAYARSLLVEAFPSSFDDDERSEIVAVIRALGRMGATLADPSARFGEPLEALATQLALTFVAGLQQRADEWATP